MLWLLALLPAATGALLLASGVQHRGTLALIAGLGLAATLALVPIAVVAGWTGRLQWSGTLALQAALTPLSALVAALVPAVALPVLVYAAYRERATGLVRLLGLLLLFCGAMELIVIADDLLTLLIGWEVVGACSWALIAHHWREAENPRSARYAFVMTRFGDTGLFLAAMSAYAGSGSFAYADLARLDAPHLAVVAFGVVLSAASKSGQIPFSPWLFRAMAGPVSVSALLHAATMVAAGAYLLARLQPWLAPVSGFGFAVMAIGSATALAGGVVALLQSDVKKVLAASTSAHFGLMFVAVGAGFPGVAVLHLVAHGFFKALLFLCAGVAIDQSGGHALSAMRLGRTLPVVAVMAAIGAASLAGLPPLGGAWTKDAIVTATAGAGLGWSGAVIVAGGLSAAYAVRWVWLAFGLGQASPPDKQVSLPPPRQAMAAAASLGWLAGCRQRAAVGALAARGQGTSGQHLVDHTAARVVSADGGRSWRGRPRRFHRALARRQQADARAGRAYCRRGRLVGPAGTDRLDGRGTDGRAGARLGMGRRHRHRRNAARCQARWPVAGTRIGAD
jgi:NADH:ubiquinone oxidoreductase subunit 5 (subunit L)/multisubunit Na+/H+ antiporter MnhA subunit